jgi:hypothetical protein
MGSSLAEQLQEALKASQARANKGTPEAAALDILVGEIDKLVKVVKKNEAATPAPPTDEAPSTKPVVEKVYGAPRGMMLLPSATTPFTLWLRRAKPGDKFYADAANIKNDHNGYRARFYASAKDQGKEVTVNLAAALFGPLHEARAEPIFAITMIGETKNEPVQPAGAPNGSADGGSS